MLTAGRPGMEKRVIEVIKAYIEENVADDVDVTAQNEFVSDLGLTSLDVFSIVAAFEDEFDIEIPDRIVQTFTTVQELIDYLEENAEEGSD